MAETRGPDERRAPYAREVRAAMEPRPEPHAWVTYVIIAANLAGFAYELANGADAMGPSPGKMLELGGSYPPWTMDGEWWRLLSSMFLHYGVLHLGMNMLCMWQARGVEEIYGRLPFAALYAVSGLAGGVATLIVGGNGVAAGASGAVFGVYGAFAGYLLVRRATMPAHVWRHKVQQLAIFLGINFVIGLSIPSVSMAAHVGGLIGGCALGAVMLATRRSDR